MKKERLASFKKESARQAAAAGRWCRSHRDLRQGSGRRLDQGSRRPGEYRLQPGVLLRAGQRRSASAARRRGRAAEDRRGRVRRLRALRRDHRRQAPRSAAVRPPLHHLPASGRGRGALRRQLTRRRVRGLSRSPLMNASLSALLTLGRQVAERLRGRPPVRAAATTIPRRGTRCAGRTRPGAAAGSRRPAPSIATSCSAGPTTPTRSARCAISPSRIATGTTPSGCSSVCWRSRRRPTGRPSPRGSRWATTSSGAWSSRGARPSAAAGHFKAAHPRRSRLRAGRAWRWATPMKRPASTAMPSGRGSGRPRPSPRCRCWRAWSASYRQDARPSRMIALYRNAAAARSRRPGAGGRARARLLRARDAGRGHRAVREARDAGARHAGGPRVPGRGVRAQRRGARRRSTSTAGRCGSATPSTGRIAATSCSATAPTWQDRCPQCQRWNTLRPSPGSLSRALHAWAVAALDLVFPALCPLCASTLAERRRDPLCGACWEAIARLAPPGCDRCGLPWPTFDPAPPGIVPPGERQCGACRADPPGVGLGASRRRVREAWSATRSTRSSSGASGRSPVRWPRSSASSGRRVAA